MKLRKLDISNTEEVTFFKSLYLESFPLSERRPIEKMMELCSAGVDFYILLAVSDNQLVGFLSYWDLDDFIFAEHFAISSAFRNGGYGGKVIKLLLENVDKPIVLEVELPNTILAERRIGFYQRMKFKLWEEVKYQQPPYHSTTNPVPMKLMSYGDIDIENHLTDIRDKIYSKVYNT